MASPSVVHDDYGLWFSGTGAFRLDLRLELLEEPTEFELVGGFGAHEERHRQLVANSSDYGDSVALRRQSAEHRIFLSLPSLSLLQPRVEPMEG